MPEASTPAPHERVAEAIASLWWLPLVRGVLLLAVGGYALFRPGMTIEILTHVIGAFVIADGILCIIAGIMAEVPSRGWVVVRGALEILVGAFVFANPIIVAGITATVLISVLAISAILTGVLEIVAAIQDRKQIKGGGWLSIGGAITVLFGVVLLISPLSFGLFMVRVLGAFAIFSGVSMIVFAFRLRGVGRTLRG